MALVIGASVGKEIVVGVHKIKVISIDGPEQVTIAREPNR